ncbi:MAG: hypothetical protein Q8L56_03305 [Rhodocyclaceae bacterium]|nr:hypothetical protein [Rhodocyclaceae bacterium]
MTTTVRLPQRVEQALAEYCVAHRKTKSEVIVESLDRLLVAPAESRRKTPYELAMEVGFIGCFEGSGETGNYKERVKAAIRAKHKR